MARKENGLVAAGPSPKNLPNAEASTTAEKNKAPEEKAENQKLQAWKYGAENFNLFVDRNSVAYAKEKVGREAIFEVESGEFRRKLLNGIRKKRGVIVDIAAINSATAALVAEAAETGNVRDVFRRVGHQDGSIYFALGRGMFAAIARGGWTVERQCPVDFITPAGMLSLPIPEKGGSACDLRVILGMERNDPSWILISAFVLGAMCPLHPTAALVLEGQQGSGKSMLARILKALIDPEENDIRTMPGTERELFVLTRKRWLLAFDNLSGLSNHMQDTLCRVITGASFSTRKLFSDSDEVNIAARMPMILNGIDSIATRPDLAERSMCISLPTMPAHRRRVETEIWAEFRKQEPRILGAFFTALSSALGRLPLTRLESPPRMIDFARLVSAGEEALGHAPGAFLRAFELNQRESVRSGLDALPAMAVLCEVVREMFNSEIEEDATGLLWRINEKAGADAQRATGWPKSPGALSGQIKRATPTLLAHGIEASHDRSSAKRLWRLRLTAEARKSSSSSSQPSKIAPMRIRHDANDDDDAAARAWAAANRRDD